MNIRLCDPLPDVEPQRIRMWCRRCEANVDTVRKDCGIGRFEYWGCKGVHVDMRDVCVTCGDDDLKGAHAESEGLTP